MQYKINLDTSAQCAILGGPPVLPLPEGATIPRQLAGSEEEINAVAEVVAGGRLGLGKWQKLAANRFSEAFRVPHVVLAANGTVVIPQSLRILGVREGDLAYVPALTFKATGGGCIETKVEPVLAEVLPNNFTIDPAWVRADLLRRKRSGEPIPKAIFAVALYTQLPDMPALRAIADEFGLWLILDFAHGPYGEIAGRPVASWADIITFSFQQSKSLPLGEGGAIAANDPRLLWDLRTHVNCGYTPWDLLGVEGPGYGMPPQGIELPEECKPAESGNYRLAEPQAALLYHRIPRFMEMQRIAARTITELEQVIRAFDFITPLTPVADVTTPCFYKWGFAIDPSFMLIDIFRPALWEEINHEVIFPYPALSLGDERNPLRPDAVARWITDEHYLARIADLAKHPIAEGALDRVALIEWQFLLLGSGAAPILRAALSKIARNRDALITAA